MVASVQMSLGVYVLHRRYIGSIRKYLPTRQPSLHTRSAGSFVPARTSTTGTCFPSLSTEATVGRIRFELTMTIRCSHEEVVFLRLEANRTNCFITPSSRSQSKNARVLNEGEEDGSKIKAERRGDTVAPYSVASVSRAGRDDGENTMRSK